MRDKRPVDELSIEELEKVLAIKRREARQQQLARMKRDGRIVDKDPDPAPFALPFEPAGETLAQSRSNPQNIAQPASKPVPKSVPKAQAQSGKSKRSPTPQFIDEPAQQTNDAWRIFVNRSLLLVEVVAVMGLLFIGLNMVGAINSLQEETANAQRMANEERAASLPTLEPTPTLRIADVVLPSGHVVVDRQARFNEDEVPEHLRMRISDEIYNPPIQRPAPTSETALWLEIPKLDISEGIIQGTDWEALRQGVGQVLNGGNPTDIGSNVVLAAHNDIYAEIFRYLDQLEAGDEFRIRTATQTFTYVVHDWEIVEPDAVHVMDHQAGRSLATLISCYPYGISDKRIVVFAERVDTLPNS